MDHDCRYSDARWKYQEMPQTALPPHVAGDQADGLEAAPSMRAANPTRACRDPNVITVSQQSSSNPRTTGAAESSHGWFSASLSFGTGNRYQAWTENSLRPRLTPQTRFESRESLGRMQCVVLHAK
ncbi:hypothetical protein VTJ04DRAFT_2936 [Mycothermus thermophilus]|uniref:uncharacterized protein n=1 Tax=Humicola insolens TaxID=85995 RepID=UPI00374345E9